MKKILREIMAYLRQTDKILFLLVILLTAFGIVMVYSATIYLGTQTNIKMVLVQIIAAVIGIICMIILSKIDYHSLASLWKLILPAAIFMLLLVLVFGKGGNGQTEQKLWISLGFVNVQLSEIVKIMLIITFAKHCDMVKDDINSIKNVALLALHAMIPIGLIALEKDMGMLCVYLFMFACMLFAANLKLRYFVGGGVALIAAAPLAWQHIPSKVKYRVLAIINPDTYASTYAYQQLHGLNALGSGEVWGWGLFNGPITQSTASSALTQRFNDMIFSVIGEELGFVGCVATVAVMAVLLVRILMISRKSRDVLGSVMCVGVFGVFSFQIIANIGMNLMLSPVIGITLPFISYGGSSILSCYFAAGLVLSVYMRRSNNLLFSKNNETDFAH